MDGQDEREIRVQFFTKQQRHEVTDAPIAVPTRLRRIHLSQMVNHLLGLAAPLPFDFLINGAFLRVSLQKYVDENNISSEEILQLEYIEAMVPPEPQTEIKQDDWISSVAGYKPGSFILTGSYDKTARIWTETVSISASSSPFD